MADDDLLVTISGAALSLLLYENARSHDQVGFLLGEVLIYITKKVTDSAREIELTKTHINIKSIIVYPDGEAFYDTPGRISDEKVKKFLQQQTKKVVGWYHYRRNFEEKLTLRDLNMHKDLSSFFSRINQCLATDNFIFCRLTSKKNETGGTHKFKHVLLRLPSFGRDFVPVPMKINNLGADATRPDGSDYKPAPTHSSCESDCFDEVYKSIEEPLKNLSGVQQVQLIQMAAERLLDEIIPEVNKSDKEVAKLQKQLNELRHKKFQDECERAQINRDLQALSQVEMENKRKASREREMQKSWSSDLSDIVLKNQPSGSRKNADHHSFSSQEGRLKPELQSPNSPEVKILMKGESISPKSPMNYDNVSQISITSAKDISPSGSESPSQITKTGNVRQKTAHFIQASATNAGINSATSNRYKKPPNHKSSSS